MKLHVTEAWAETAGKILARAIALTIGTQGRCRLAICGGSTPGPVFEWLAENLEVADLPALWVTWVDERMTADRSARNDTLAYGKWLDHQPLGRVLPMRHTGDLRTDRDRYAAVFEKEFGGLDVVLLGAGPDGHIASLFPGHPALNAGGFCVGVSDSPKPPPIRLSLTLPLLQAVDCAVLVARGEDKAQMLGRARAGDRDLPLGRYQPQGDYHWVLDPAAGGAL